MTRYEWAGEDYEGDHTLGLCAPDVTPDSFREPGGGNQSTQLTQVYSGIPPEGDESVGAAGFTEVTDSTELTDATDSHLLRRAGELAAAFLADLRRLDRKYPAWRVPFELARVLRALPAESPVVFEDVVAGFFRAAGADEFAGWVSFLACWPLVRCPAGQDPWDLAVEAAKARPFVVRPDPGPRLAPLASVAAYLAAARPGEPFVFPLGRIMGSFGLTRMTASRAVTSLVALGVIAFEDRSWSYTEGRARTFRFIGTICDPVSAAVARG
jgi:hypothetical protein